MIKNNLGRARFITFPVSADSQVISTSYVDWASIVIPKGTWEINIVVRRLVRGPNATYGIETGTIAITDSLNNIINGMEYNAVSPNITGTTYVQNTEPWIIQFITYVANDTTYKIRVKTTRTDAWSYTSVYQSGSRFYAKNLDF